MSDIGVMPLARKLGDILDAREKIPELGPITVQPVQLNYRAWGFASQAEMDAAFNEGTES